MVLNWRSTETIRDREKEGEGGMELGGEGDYIPNAILSPPGMILALNGSDESHFNVSVGSDGQSHKTVSIDHNLFEEKRRAEAVSNRGPSAY